MNSCAKDHLLVRDFEDNVAYEEHHECDGIPTGIKMQILSHASNLGVANTRNGQFDATSWIDDVLGAYFVRSMLCIVSTIYSIS
jgi:hypothetical protein